MKKILKYLRPYTLHMVLVLVCMLTSTVTSLIGSYLLSPVINHIAGVDMGKDASFFTELADKIISGVNSTTDAAVRTILCGSNGYPNNALGHISVQRVH